MLVLKEVVFFARLVIGRTTCHLVFLAEPLVLLLHKRIELYSKIIYNGTLENLRIALVIH